MDAGFKLKVVKFAKKTSNCAAAREFTICEKLVRDWRKAEVELRKMPKTKCARRGGKAPPLYLLCEWVVRAWAAIDAKIVENSFLKCSISNSLDGEEDNWLWKDMDAEDNTADAEEE